MSLFRYSIDDDPKIAAAIQEIYNTYGDLVSVGSKKKQLIKFGRNTDLSTTQEQVWLQGGTEDLPSDNIINTLVSTNAGDDQTVTIEGHTISGNNLTFVTQPATINGTTDVTLTTSLARATRLLNGS